MAGDKNKDTPQEEVYFAVVVDIVERMFVKCLFVFVTFAYRYCTGSLYKAQGV